MKRTHFTFCVCHMRHGNQFWGLVFTQMKFLCVCVLSSIVNFKVGNDLKTVFYSVTVNLLSDTSLICGSMDFCFFYSQKLDLFLNLKNKSKRHHSKIPNQSTNKEETGLRQTLSYLKTKILWDSFPLLYFYPQIVSARVELCFKKQCFMFDLSSQKVDSKKEMKTI